MPPTPSLCNQIYVYVFVCRSLAEEYHAKGEYTRETDALNPLFEHFFRLVDLDREVRAAAAVRVVRSHQVAVV